MMEFYQVINNRRSIRQFEDKEIQREVLERILDAGLKAPSSNHQRRWELVTLTDKAIIHDLAQIVHPYPCRITEPKTPQQEMFKIAYPRQRSTILPFIPMDFVLHSCFYLGRHFGVGACVAENDQRGKIPAVRDFQKLFDLFRLFLNWNMYDRPQPFRSCGIKRIIEAGMKAPSWDHYRNW